jgi:hypothetical protein
MTTTEYANAGQATRAVKALINDPGVPVRTRQCFDAIRSTRGWHATIHIERGEQRNAIIAALLAAGWQVDRPHEYDSFTSAFMPIPEPKGDAQRGEAFLQKTFGSTTRTEF